jgi:hypothetical protein
MGAVADILLMGDWTRPAQWALAAAVAIAGTTGCSSPASSTCMTPSTPAAPAMAVAPGGRRLFGVGMVLASGCGAKTLVRLGGGNLKSLVVFVFLGLSAYMTLRGLFGGWRSAWLDPVASPSTATRICPASSPPASPSTAAPGSPAPWWRRQPRPVRPVQPRHVAPSPYSAASPSAPPSSPAGI